MNNFNKIKKNLNEKVLLGVGPVSRNVIDATINVVNKYQVPILLIPSRRQIDDECDHPYVWTTKEFAQYVKNKDLYGNILLARDHGRPSSGILERVSSKRNI